MSLPDTSSEFMFPVIAGTILFSSLVIFIIYFMFLHNKARQRFEQERHRFKQALLQTEVEIREQTLIHVSRELHDNLGQIASLIKINLNMISGNIPEKEKEKIGESLDLLRQLIGDIKSLSVSLNSENIERIGLLEAIANDVTRINRAGGVQVNFTHDTTLPIFRPGTEVFLFRMCQELLNNMLQHADASECGLAVLSGDTGFSLTFTDNGKGFDREKLVRKGSGLTNLEERCRLIGAELFIDSKPGTGTRIRIQLPVK